MSNLSIALIKPNAQLAEALDPFLQRSGIDVTVVDDVDELFGLPIAQIDLLDGVLVPLRLGTGSTGVNSCVQIRDHDMFRRLPVIGLCITRETRVIDSFHEVGADAVYATPFDSDAIISQIRALSRRNNVYEQRLEPDSQDMLKQFTACLHALPEAIIIFDLRGSLYFGNDKARKLFALGDETTPDDVADIENLVRPFLEEHKRTCGYDPSSTSWHQSTIPNPNGNIPISLSISQLEDFHPGAKGFCVQLRNSSDLEWVRNNLSQVSRLRSLLSLSQACLTEFLPKTQAGILMSPLERIAEVNAQTSSSCSLNAVVSSLLEFLDLVLSPELTIKVSGMNAHLAVKASDLMQLLSELILLASDFCGAIGEVSIDGSSHVPGEGVSLTVSATAKRPASRLQPSPLANMIQHEVLNFHPTEGQMEGKILSGISAAEQLASKLRTELQYQHNPGELKLRVKLPADLK